MTQNDAKPMGQSSGGGYSRIAEQVERERQFIAGASEVVNMIPGLGGLKLWAEMNTGTDLFTGERQYANEYWQATSVFLNFLSGTFITAGLASESMAGMSGSVARMGGTMALRTEATAATGSGTWGLVSAGATTTGSSSIGVEQAATMTGNTSHPLSALEPISSGRGVSSLAYLPYSANVRYSFDTFNEHLGAAPAAEELKGLTIKTVQEQGREFRIDKLQTYEFDPNQPSHIRGWLKQERLRVERGLATEPRTPPGYEQSHAPGRPAREGYDYNNSALNFKANNQLEEAARRKLK